MKKVLIVICVLSLLSMLAVPVLAQVLTESGSYDEVAPLPGGIRLLGVEEPVQVARLKPGGLT